MNNEKIIAGFLGAGGIARSHAFALNSLKYFYDDAPHVVLSAVCSSSEGTRDYFADRFGFLRACDKNEFFKDEEINTVYILGPNKVHYEHLKSAMRMKSVRRIYLEKPVCSTIEEETLIRNSVLTNPGIRIQVGFQYLFTASVREALSLWRSGILGKPVHFEFKYYHPDYLKKEYRKKRMTRLTPAPDGGAMADLGSHAISLLVAFLGNHLRIKSALQAGSFDDVPEGSDLYSLISIVDENSLAAGTVASSRISSGTGDDLSFEIYAEKGAIRYSSSSPHYFEYFEEDSGVWSLKQTGSNFRTLSTFPSIHVPPGWHRSMIHAHYVFIKGSTEEPVLPDIEHGLQVQRLVRETAEELANFRRKKSQNN